MFEIGMCVRKISTVRDVHNGYCNTQLKTVVELVSVSEYERTEQTKGGLHFVVCVGV